MSSGNRRPADQETGFQGTGGQEIRRQVFREQEVRRSGDMFSKNRRPGVQGACQKFCVWGIT
jgi:hypothetical protein